MERVSLLSIVSFMQTRCLRMMASLAPPSHDPYRQQHHWVQQHLVVGWPIALLACASVASSSLPAFIGTSWSLIETRQEGEFLSGVLVNPRGGVLPGRIYVIANEWDCG